MKLKKLLEESSAPGFKDRKFGDALPTLASIKAAYDAKQGTVNEGPKDDFVAGYKGTMISLMNGYKHHSEGELYKMYETLGKSLKGKTTMVDEIIVVFKK
tara:strand:- start:206 stop:505 length:300 start_codon:yes stop_codon:yes gene_type:complete